MEVPAGSLTHGSKPEEQLQSELGHLFLDWMLALTSCASETVAAALLTPLSTLLLLDAVVMVHANQTRHAAQLARARQIAAHAANQEPLSLEVPAQCAHQGREAPLTKLHPALLALLTLTMLVEATAALLALTTSSALLVPGNAFVAPLVL